MDFRDKFLGCLLGTAVGDAIGLPYEGLSARRAARLLGAPTRHRFSSGRGMVSDDTEHAIMTAQAWIASGGDVSRFAPELARRLKWWLLGIPAGIGKATLLSCLRLWIGVRPDRSGVRSAGNGPAMRAPLLGLLARDEEELMTLVAASTLITHRDPRALHGALVIAVAARYAASVETPDIDDFSALCAKILCEQPDHSQMQDAIAAALTAVRENRYASTRAFVEAQGWRRGASGFILQTVPAVIHAWLLHPRDLRAAIIDVIEAGGDTDTTAAILGGIVGGAAGTAGIPDDWQRGIWDSHARPELFERLTTQLASVSHSRAAEPSARWPAWRSPVRNLFFFGIVLLHIFRRTLPPY